MTSAEYLADCPLDEWGVRYDTTDADLAIIAGQLQRVAAIDGITLLDSATPVLRAERDRLAMERDSLDNDHYSFDGVRR